MPDIKYNGIENPSPQNFVSAMILKEIDEDILPRPFL